MFPFASTVLHKSNMEQGFYFQDTGNVFLDKKGENMIVTLPFVQDSLLIDCKE